MRLRPEPERPGFFERVAEVARTPLNDEPEWVRWFGFAAFGVWRFAGACLCELLDFSLKGAVVGGTLWFGALYAIARFGEQRGWWEPCD